MHCRLFSVTREKNLDDLQINSHNTAYVGALFGDFVACRLSGWIFSMTFSIRSISVVRCTSVPILPRHGLSPCPCLEQAARFHLVVQGQCTVALPGSRALVLNPGDLILIPRGQTHILSDTPVEQAPALETVIEQVQYDGNGVLTVGEGDPMASTQLVCGHLTFRDKADHALLRAMPDHLVVTAAMRAKKLMAR